MKFTERTTHPVIGQQSPLPLFFLSLETRALYSRTSTRALFLPARQPEAQCRRQQPPSMTNSTHQSTLPSTTSRRCRRRRRIIDRRPSRTNIPPTWPPFFPPVIIIGRQSSTQRIAQRNQNRRESISTIGALPKMPTRRRASTHGFDSRKAKQCDTFAPNQSFLVDRRISLSTRRSVSFACTAHSNSMATRRRRNRNDVDFARRRDEAASQRSCWRASSTASLPIGSNCSAMRDRNRPGASV